MSASHAPLMNDGRQAPGTWDGAKVEFVLLRNVFTVAPILSGIHKYARVLTSDWERYLAPWTDNLIPGDARTARAFRTTAEGSLSVTNQSINLSKGLNLLELVGAASRGVV